MKKILENLQATTFFSEADFAEVESYIATQYKDVSPEEVNTILNRYLQQKIEQELTQFYPKYLLYVRFRLILNVLSRRPYRIMAIDILKACMQLDIQSDDFYIDLKNWMTSFNFPTVSETEIDAFITQLRLLRTQGHPELSYDELFQTDNFLSATEHTAPTIQNEAISTSETGNESFDSSVKISLDELGWNSSESEEPSPPKRLFTITKIVLAGIAGLLMSICIGMWLTLSYNKESAQKVAAHPPIQRPAGEPEVSNQTSETAKDIAYPARVGTIGTNNIANRSRVSAYPASTPETVEPEKGQNKNSESKVEKSVITDYQEVTTDGATSKVPVFQNFSTKLVMQVHGYSPALKDNMSGSEYSPGDTTPGKTKTATQGKTIVVDANTISPGSRVYLKFPQEYHHLNGVYLAESSDVASGDKPINIVSKTAPAAKEGMVPTFACEAVEVYVLDDSE
jgi:hypothetical protein